MAATFRAFGRKTPPREPANKPTGPRASAMINKDVELALAAGVLEEYDSASQRYKCVVCPKSGCGDVIPHLASLPHNNAATWETINTKDPSSAMLRIVSETIQKAKIHHEIEAMDKIVFSFQCKICPGKRPFNGLAPLEAHLQGGDHAKNRGRISFSRPGPALESDFPVIQKSYQDHAFLRESPESAVPQEYRISPISPAIPQQSRLSPAPSSERGHPAWQSENPGNTSIWSTEGGNSLYSPYLPRSTSSSSHSTSESSFQSQQYENTTPAHAVTVYSYKDSLSLEAQDALSSGIIEEHGSNDGYSSYYCTACKVPLNGIKPLKQHLESVKHKKKVTGPQMGQLIVESGPLSSSAREALHDGIVEDKGGSYFCKICSIPLTGPAPLNQHADSEKHRKKVDLQLGNSLAKLQISSQSRVRADCFKSAQLTHDSRQLTQQDIESSRMLPLKEMDTHPYFPWHVRSATTGRPFSKEIYRSSSIPRGMVVIFNYYFSGLNARHGAPRDSQNLKILFTQMGYFVRLHENYSKEQTLSEFGKIQTDPHLRNYDSFVCIILSHGKNDSSFYTMSSTMEEELDIDEIRYLFLDSACPQLKNKPKIFLTNFCRGKIKEKVPEVEYDFIPSKNSEAPQDMLTLFASIRNFSAARDVENGTIFVQAICQVFSENAHDTEIMDLYRKLSFKMQMLGGTTPEQQSYNFKKHFYFNPVNIEDVHN